MSRTLVTQWLSASVVLAASLLGASRSAAQDPALLEMFGTGVHAFFAGQPTVAYQHLSASINGGSNDPRAFYFRGLTYLQLGRPTEAEADFVRGAGLEAHEAAGLYPVDRSLERIQGRARLAVERHRNAARLAALQQLGSERIDRSLRIQGAQPEVLAPPRPPMPGEAGAADPQGDPSTPPVGPPKPAAPMKPAAADPFGAAAPADPFGAAAPAEGAAPPPASPPANPADPAADPVAAPPAKPTAPPKPKGSNPFEEQDPFGEKAATDPAAAPPMPALQLKPPAPPPAKPEPANEPFAPPPAAPQKPAAPPTTDAAEAAPTSGKALGNAVKKVLGGLLPEVPVGVTIPNPFAEVPPAAGAAPPATPPASPPAATDSNAAPAKAPPATKPAATDDPFATPPPATKPAETKPEKDPFGN